MFDKCTACDVASCDKTTAAAHKWSSNLGQHEPTSWNVSIHTHTCTHKLAYECYNFTVACMAHSPAGFGLKKTLILIEMLWKCLSQKNRVIWCCKVQSVNARFLLRKAGCMGIKSHRISSSSSVQQRIFVSCNPCFFPAKTCVWMGRLNKRLILYIQISGHSSEKLIKGFL